ncbi:acetyl-CoA C-acetyltransferase [Bermanella marisrubri]|uniref:Acetyl-CoA acetyltransferase n=1 Tax=Bermanella marisrubri TaxID=207949 RepID=Q1N0K8_9GAMM|nr:acetyl-CoA C-acetyltransferase [Bermanella marisrubri]EAT11825.1 acetyl-CoA acetyltransferase [Oceanobacter sp. RED65] [Bermanella marisrubri]QIZ83859.1 acetyl-CoA C-acetyltransferase [Bermanella marisrubri]
MSFPKKVAIVAANRIPFAKSNTAYFGVSNQQMLTAAIQGLVEKNKLKGERLGEVVAGAVMKHSQDFNLVRESVLDTELCASTPCTDLQQACGTGLQSFITVANKIALGQIESGIAGGVDTTSDAPIAVSDKFHAMLMKLNKAKTTGERLKILASFRPSFLAPKLPRNGEPRTGLSMGGHTELTAKRWQIPRQEQDKMAYESHQKLNAAYERGFMDDLITAFNGLDKDNLLRPDTKVEKLAMLKPAFDRETGSLTAGNSSALTDGASAVLLATEEWAKERGLPVLAYLTDYETAAVDFIGKDSDYEDDLLLAPAYAVPRMLQRNNLSLQDFDFYEIHEAFAAQVLATLKAWSEDEFCQQRLGLDKALGEIDKLKLNVNGSSLATGHPFAATGGRILGNLAKLLNEKGSGRGLISICAAGGQGVVAILEK